MKWQHDYQGKWTMVVTGEEKIAGCVKEKYQSIGFAFGHSGEKPITTKEICCNFFSLNDQRP